MIRSVAGGGPAAEEMTRDRIRDRIPRDDAVDAYGRIAVGATGRAMGRARDRVDPWDIRHLAIGARPSSAAGPQLLAALSLASAVIHATVIGEHLAEYPPYGWFFLAVTLFQVTWGVVVLITPTRTWLAFGIVSNSALLVIWLWSRTSGLPIGPDPGMAEAIGLPDVVCCLYEILLVATAVATLSVRPLARREGGRAIALTVVLLAIATALVISAPRPVADHAGGMRSMAMGRAGADRAIVAVAGSPTHPASRR